MVAQGLQRPLHKLCRWWPLDGPLGSPMKGRKLTRPSVMIEKFAGTYGLVRSEFLDLNHTGKSMILVSLMIPKFAPESGGEVWRTSESGH
jgi:hypothetical protein